MATGVMATGAWQLALPFGRAVLVGKDGLADTCMSIGGGPHLELMSRHYKKEFDLAHLPFPASLKARGRPFSSFPFHLSLSSVVHAINGRYSSKVLTFD